MAPLLQATTSPRIRVGAARGDRPSIFPPPQVHIRPSHFPSSQPDTLFNFMPGRIYPSDAPRTQYPSEVAVWNALARQLPDGWVAWHSLSIRTERGQYGEGDFIIAAPEWGFIVLEVKGGQVYERNGHWYQGQKRLQKCPLSQAHDYRTKFHGELRRVYDKNEIEGKCAVCLPDIVADNRPTNSDYRDILIDGSQLGELEACLRKAFEVQFSRGNAPRDPSWIDRITDLWGDNWEPRIGMMGQSRLSARDREGLNDRQLTVVEGLNENQYVHVVGVAGTGKTTVATRLAMDWAYQGKSVRYLCFTEALAHWVEASFREQFCHYDADIKAISVRGLAETWAQAWDLKVNDPPGTSAYWTNLMMKVSAATEEHTITRPEVIIVDEAQSFNATDWKIIEHLKTEQGKLWTFRDPNQSFWDDRELSPAIQNTAFTTFNLPKQQRMPSAIEALAFAYLEGRSPDSAVQKFDSALIRVIECGQDPSELLALELDRLVAEGFRPQQIAVATICGMKASRLWARDKIGQHTVVHADDERADRNVVLDTFFRLQGLDRDVVIVCEGDAPKATRNYPKRMHQALTRAAAGVVILAGPGLWERDRVLTALREAGKLPSA